MTAFEGEFLANIGAVVFDCAIADEEFHRDLFAGFVFGNQLQHAPFGRGQIIEAGELLDQRCHARGPIE